MINIIVILIFLLSIYISIKYKFIQFKCNIDNWHQFINLTGYVYVISMLKIEGENYSIKDAIDFLVLLIAFSSKIFPSSYKIITINPSKCSPIMKAPIQEIVIKN